VGALNNHPAIACHSPVLAGDFSLNLAHHIEVTGNDREHHLKPFGREFVAPEVRELKGDIRALAAKFDALHAEFNALHSEFSALHSEFESLRSESRLNQQALIAALQNAVLRGEMGTQREISELRERVTRIEDQLRTLTQ
jgi:chromosome segregation ATPase